MDKVSLADLVAAIAGPAAAAAVGTVMRRIDQLRAGSIWQWRRLLFDLPSVAGIGIMAHALAELMTGSATVAAGIAAAGGYLGHEWLVEACRRYVAGRRPKE